MSWSARLSRWFFAPSSARHLAVVRIAIGLYAIGWLTISSTELIALGELDPARYDPVGIVALVGVEPVGRSVIGVGVVVTVLAAATVASGRWHRVAGPVFGVGLLLLATYQNSWGKLLHTENLLVVHALILAVSPAGDALVVGARRRWVTAPRYGWPLRVMAVATVLSYLLAGIAKLRYGGLTWLTADNLRNWVAFDLVRKELFGDPYVSAVVGALDHLWPFAVAAVFTVAVEVGAPLALVGRRWARVWVGAAWALHAGVLVVMAVGFPYPLLGVAFLPVLWASGAPRRGPPDAEAGEGPSDLAGVGEPTLGAWQ